jgi:hypothetical protein
LHAASASLPSLASDLTSRNQPGSSVLISFAIHPLFSIEIVCSHSLTNLSAAASSRGPIS